MSKCKHGYYDVLCSDCDYEQIDNAAREALRASSKKITDPKLTNLIKAAEDYFEELNSAYCDVYRLDELEEALQAAIKEAK